MSKEMIADAARKQLIPDEGISVSPHTHNNFYEQLSYFSSEFPAPVKQKGHLQPSIQNSEAVFEEVFNRNFSKPSFGSEKVVWTQSSFLSMLSRQQQSIVTQDQSTLRVINRETAAKQLFRDYLKGKSNVSFGDLRSINVATTERAKAIYVVPGVILNIESELQGKDLVLIPLTDEQHFYQWLEAYNSNPINGKTEGECFVSARIVNGKLVQRGWNGPEKQLLKDYINGNGSVALENLRPIPLIRGRTDVLSLWKEGGQKFYLPLSQHFGLKEGDVFELIPQDESAGTIRFLLQKDDLALGNYSLNRETKLFKLEGVSYSIIEWDFTYDKEKDCYTDARDEEWLPLHTLSRRYRVADPVLLRFLEDVPLVRGTYRSGQTTFYKASEALRAIEDSGYLERRPQRKKEKKPVGYWKPEIVENNAREFYDAEGGLSYTLLQEKGRGDLAAAIVSYPGKLRVLKEKIGVPKKQKKVPEHEDSKKKRVAWSTLNKDPEQLQIYLETEARKLVEEGVRLTQRGLIEAEASHLMNGINRYYPGKLTGLQRKVLGVAKRNRFSHRVVHDEAGIPRHVGGEIAWRQLKDNAELLQALIEPEVQKYLDEGHTLSAPQMKKAERGDLSNAISMYYPGRFTRLKERFGLKKIPGDTNGEERLDKYIRENPDIADTPSIARIKELIKYQKDNPGKNTPYTLLVTLDDFVLYHKLHPEWQGKYLSALRDQEEADDRWFHNAFNNWVKKEAQGDARKSQELIGSIFPGRERDWSALITIDDWREELQKRPDWVGKSTSEIQKDSVPGGVAFYAAFLKWTKSHAANDEELRSLREQLFPPRYANRWSSLKTLEDWRAAFNEHPEWQGRSGSQMRNEKESGANAFFQAYRKWIKKNVKITKERLELLHELFPPLQKSWAAFTNIEDWISEFHNHPEWQGRSQAEMDKDSESGGHEFSRAFGKWLGRATDQKEERANLKRQIFVEKRSRSKYSEQPAIKGELFSLEEAHAWLERFFEAEEE